MGQSEKDGRLVPMRANEADQLATGGLMEVLLPPADTAGVTGPPLMSRRFRQFLPVVIDVETGGFNCATDALLEIAAVMIEFGPDGRLQRGAFALLSRAAVRRLQHRSRLRSR